jgi:hypothetical protein
MELKKEISKDESNMMIDAGTYLINLFNGLVPEERTRYAYLNLVVIIDKLDAPKEIKLRMLNMLRDELVRKQERKHDASID